MHYYYPVQLSGFWEQLGRNRNRIVKNSRISGHLEPDIRYIPSNEVQINTLQPCNVITIVEPVATESAARHHVSEMMTSKDYLHYSKDSSKLLLQPSLLQSRRPRSDWYLWPFWCPFGCVRWSVCSMTQNNQAWPTELFYRCSSRLELTSTTSPLFVRKSPTVSSWAQDSSLQGSLHCDNLWELLLKSDLNWAEGHF